jgi:hypothetical protein
MFSLLTRMRCWSGHGSLYRQVAETGYIFGAYTAVAWPKQPTAGSSPMSVPDPSGSSFLFSLVNAYGRPFRLSLVDRSYAVSVSATNGPMFGGRILGADCKVVKYSNLVLMLYGEAANESGGIWSSHHSIGGKAYQLDAWKDTPPVGFKLDWDTLAGTHLFAAAEIECYSL